MSDSFVFTVPSLVRPAIFTPHIIEEPYRQLFGAMILADAVPHDLRKLLPSPRWVSDMGADAYRFFSQTRPAVICEGDLRTTLSCTDAANLSRDELLGEIEAAVCVRVVQIDPGRGRGESRALAVVEAVKVEFADVVRRYDEICAKYFADPSLPYRGKPIR